MYYNVMMHVFFMPDIVNGSDWKVVLQKDPCSKWIVAEVVDPMLVATLGNNDMETIEQFACIDKCGASCIKVTSKGRYPCHGC